MVQPTKSNAMNAITVHAESGRHSEVWAVFTDEEIYLACFPALEKLAKEHRMIITESVETVIEND